MTFQTHLSAAAEIVIQRDMRDGSRWTTATRFPVPSLDVLRAFAPTVPAQPLSAINGIDDAALPALLGDD